MNIKTFFVCALATVFSAVSLVCCGGGGGGADNAGYISVGDFKRGAKSFYGGTGMRSLQVVPEEVGDLVNSTPAALKPGSIIVRGEDEGGAADPDDPDAGGGFGQQYTVQDYCLVYGYICARGVSSSMYRCQFTYIMTEENLAKVDIICIDSNTIDDEMLIAALGFNKLGDDDDEGGNLDVNALDNVHLVIWLNFNTGMMDVQVTGNVENDDEDGGDADDPAAGGNNNNNGPVAAERVISNYTTQFFVERIR